MTHTRPGPGRPRRTFVPAKLVVEIPKDLKAKLKARADKNYRNVVDEVIEALRNHVDRGPDFYRTY